MDLQGYLDRIGFLGRPGRDHQTLAAIHRRHVESIPFENIDVLLGRTVDFDLERIYDKIVNRRRGGWCYEMNGLFGWALGEIGFDVTRLAGGVGRSERGEEAVGNHLLLLVDGVWLADVGFGNGLYEPVTLETGELRQRGFLSHLDTVEDGWWRYTSHDGMSFDFRLDPADQDLLQDRCDYLRTSPESGLKRNLVAEIQGSDRCQSLRNSILTTQYPDRVEESVIGDENEMVNVLQTVFGIVDADVGGVWPEARDLGAAYLARDRTAEAGVEATQA
jgi:N-hydroxyarylamine O-acetyltransferase